MILLAALTVMQPAMVPPAPADEIVVVAERMKRIKLRLSRKKGVLKSCRVRVSSGDPVIDGYACEAIGTCMAEGAVKRQPLADCSTDKVLAFYMDRRSAAETSE
ncbi:MAG: hypothetical protein KYX66_15410 [Blastomonas fulva]|uniref:hypothetical protein n=1 Tax=Sphingomonadales TaxID=204457 RepID=UPI0006918303|nr:MULTISPECIES: hypothetical protein [Sphingomonadaceae]MDK2758112.1 hypothetical protein [Blastomonas fulva]